MATDTIDLAGFEGGPVSLAVKQLDELGEYGLGFGKPSWRWLFSILRKEDIVHVLHVCVPEFNAIHRQLVVITRIAWRSQDIKVQSDDCSSALGCLQLLNDILDVGHSESDN